MHHGNGWNGIVVFAQRRNPARHLGCSARLDTASAHRGRAIAGHHLAGADTADYFATFLYSHDTSLQAGSNENAVSATRTARVPLDWFRLVAIGYRCLHRCGSAAVVADGYCAPSCAAFETNEPPD